jgi:hypothetical protein
MLFIEAAFEEGFTNGWAAHNRRLAEGDDILPNLWVKAPTRSPARFEKGPAEQRGVKLGPGLRLE